MTTWTMPDPPGLDVTEVVDRLDKTWRRDETDPDLWWGDVGHGYDDPRQWHELLRRGPITSKES